ncbi:PTS system, cellobiose-specific IIB component [Spiroplasma litorale]|uniref:PTS system, cellobiose-specific IIB component n=1 Tax=Spiroplasma litorale TaxID=216942 RepID=A0A0K1W2A3_9MOLU|nr:PTS sugar transporter subunit IIB [Spiroplasma litorale]AKX34232.1 PTS system, cellobiose-specific IIB component [Spiroplasma litorale]
MAKKVLLACAAGLSTSMMVQKMQEAAKKIGLEYEIWAQPVSKAISLVNEVDFVLLGPQVRFELGRFQKASTGTPVEVIDMRAYGTMNGELVINTIKDKIK